ncbi:MAG TPA: invasion associated locus B family protein [Rhizomicrobium sp.]|jgi:hypothetical protein
MTSRTFALAVTAAVALSSTAPAFADTPVLLGVFKGWTAASAGVGSNKVCYVLAHPSSSQPAKAKRTPIGFMVSNWPGRNVAAEPEVVAGYPYREGSTVTAQIGSDRFTFFVKNDGSAGGAWIKDPADEARMIDAMKRGGVLIVIGTSKRGTTTTDNYVLAGFGDALDKTRSCT